MMEHIVWDWNGTLLDDLPLVVEAVNVSLASVGRPTISLDDYRDHFTRPVKHFYDNLAGHEIDQEEWLVINDRFHAAYHGMEERYVLTVDAAETLDDIDGSRESQSLLSMAGHEHLLAQVTRLDVKRYFDRIDGLRGTLGGLKASCLRDHLEALRLEPGSVVMIGDTPDDFHATVANGVGCVLYDGGSHHRAHLETLGPPVAGSLAEALALARRL